MKYIDEFQKTGDLGPMMSAMHASYYQKLLESLKFFQGDEGIKLQCNIQIFSEIQNCISSVQFSHSVVSNSLQPHGLQHPRLLCPSPTPRVYSNSCPLCWWCHPTISSSVVPFSSHLQSVPASESFPMSRFFFLIYMRLLEANILKIDINQEKKIGLLCKKIQSKEIEFFLLTPRQN